MPEGSSTSDGVPGGLSHPGTEVSRLLEQIRAGVHAQAGLLSADEQSRLRHHVEAYRSAESSLAEWRQSVAEVEKQVRDHPSEEGAMSRVVRQLAAANSRRPIADSELASLKERAETAEVALRADEQKRDSDTQAAIDRGVQARQDLQHLVGQRVRQALADPDTLPSWFLNSMGSRPRNAGVAEQWLTVAVRLVTFRYQYGITDELLPVGRMSELPSGVATWASQLLQDCTNTAGTG